MLFVRRSFHRGLLQGIVKIKDANFYCDKLDLKLSKQLLMNASLIYEAAVQDVKEGHKKTVDEYLNAIKHNTNSFIAKKEIYDREEILQKVRYVIESSGRFLCLLGGKSTGKSLIFKHFADPKHRIKHSSFIVVDMRSNAYSKNILEALIECLTDSSFVNIVEASLMKIVPLLLKSTPFGGLVDVGAIMKFVKDNNVNEVRILERILTELSVAYGNLTIVIDEANLVFDLHNSSDEIINKAKADLQVFTRLTKQTGKVGCVEMRFSSN